MVGKRLLELLAIAMIGEGAAGVIRPSRYLLLWRLGPQWLRDWVDQMAANPRFMRLLFLSEFAIGMLIALRTTEENSRN
jgi:hypothetical protein